MSHHLSDRDKCTKLTFCQEFMDIIQSNPNAEQHFLTNAGQAKINETA